MKRVGLFFAALVIGVVLARASLGLVMPLFDPPEIRNYQPGKPIPWTRPLPMSEAKAIVAELERRQRIANIKAREPSGLGYSILFQIVDTVTFLIDPIALIVAGVFSWIAYLVLRRTPWFNESPAV